ncbi:hypothetical protein D3C78_1527190 [compost metagenome]
MRGLAVLLLGVVLGLSGCVVYDDDYDSGYRSGRGHWDDGERHHRHWEGRDHRDHRDYRGDRWEGRRGDDWDGRRDGRRHHDDDDD